MGLLSAEIDFWLLAITVTMSKENRDIRHVSLGETITDDMKTSMKAGDTDRTNVLRLLRGAFKNEEIKIGAPLDEAAALKVLQREAKQRRDSITAYEAAARPELAAHEAAELEIISTYLPEAMSPAELEAVVHDVIAATGATDLSSMGVVIGQVMGRVGARAEGGQVSALVRQKLGGH